MTTNYKRLNKDKLLKLCQDSSIKHPFKIKKTDLIQLLIKNDLKKSNQKLDLELNSLSERNNNIVQKDNKKETVEKETVEKETVEKEKVKPLIHTKKSKKKKKTFQKNKNLNTLNLEIPIINHSRNHNENLNADTNLNICSLNSHHKSECVDNCQSNSGCQEEHCVEHGVDNKCQDEDNCCCNSENQFTDYQEISKLTNLLQLIGLKNILDQSNAHNGIHLNDKDNKDNNNCNDTNNSNEANGTFDTNNSNEANGTFDTDSNCNSKKKESFSLGDSNEILSALFYFLSSDFKQKILEKEEDWSQKKKIQDWEQYQLDKIQLITQRPCLSTETRFNLISGNLVNIDTQIIKEQDDFFEYTEHFLAKQDIMGKTFYYTSKFESDIGGQAIRCMREAYQLIKYQLQYLLNRWTKHQKQLSKKSKTQPLTEIYFINIIHGDVAEYYVKNLLYLKNQEKYKDISSFVIIGDLTYFALYWIQYHRENFVSWEKYLVQKKKIDSEMNKI